MSDILKVEGQEHLIRDVKSNAIINTDTIGYENYMRMRKRNDDKQAEMDAMKKELEELKSMLHELASKITS